LTNIKQWKSLTSQLKRILDELPSSNEREEIISSLRHLIILLEDLRNALGMLPTAEEAALAKESLAKLESVVNSNPLLRGQVNRKRLDGESRQRTNRSGTAQNPPVKDVEQMLERLYRMPEGTLRNELMNSKNYPNNLLRAMLTHLGRRVSSKGSRGELMEQLIVTIVNKRTYEGLRGDPAQG